ncbi:MAG: helix-turn-helix domain-containing protein [Bacteroidia bacterium]|nr:helix-turn-helix domain-containing protein [Bacteroidia bacterium]
MNKLKDLREKLKLTQKELSEKTHISIRTIQRIEAGKEPKGHTLKVLAKALEVSEIEVLNSPETPTSTHNPVNKWVNLSTLLVSFLPPLNIFVPLMVMSFTKTFNDLTKQLISLQIMWTVATVVLVFTSAKIRNAYALSDSIPSTTLGMLLILNLFIILRNAAEITRNQQLYIKLNFDII